MSLRRHVLRRQSIYQGVQKGLRGFKRYQRSKHQSIGPTICPITADSSIAISQFSEDRHWRASFGFAEPRGCGHGRRRAPCPASRRRCDSRASSARLAQWGLRPVRWAWSKLPQKSPQPNINRLRPRRAAVFLGSCEKRRGTGHSGRGTLARYEYVATLAALDVKPPIPFALRGLPRSSVYD